MLTAATPYQRLLAQVDPVQERYVEALVGLAGLTAFVVMRAAALNHLGTHLGGRVLSSATVAMRLELGSVLLVLVGATRARFSGTAR